MTKIISDTMMYAIKLAHEKGAGHLWRWPGGFWTYASIEDRENVLTSYNGAPQEYFSTSTINALVDRDVMTVTGVKRGRKGDFPIKVSLVAGQKMFRRAP